MHEVHNDIVIKDGHIDAVKCPIYGVGTFG